MSSRRDTGDDEDFDGIDIELPFFSMRAGRGRGRMVYDDEYRRARRKVRAKLDFYRHLATFAAVAAVLIVLDLATGGGLSWSLWVAGIWGAVIVWQAFATFVFPNLWSRETEERMIEEEMRRSRNAG